MDTIFGHLVTRFGSTQAENLATEGLNYVLGRSTEARRLFLRFLERTGRTFPSDLAFGTQAADAESGIPDLVGREASGAEAVLLEAKFWAGLTGRQPVAYLRRLPAGGLLAFIVPVQRFETLWPELLTRCREAGLAVEEEGGHGIDWRVAKLPDGKRLAVTSWRAVLEGLHAGLQQAGEVVAAADVLQLRGLADRMDSDAFLPLSSEEITANTGRRIIQLCQLVDDAVARLKSQGVADTTDCRSAGGRNGSYFRPFRLGAFGCDLIFDTHGWAARGMPLTLRVQDRRWRPSREAGEALAPLAAGDPARLIVNDWGAYFPIRLKLGVERDAVLEGVIDQIMPVAVIGAKWTPSAELPNAPQPLTSESEPEGEPH